MDYTSSQYLLMKERAPVYREGLTVQKGTIETMEPTIFFSIIRMNLLFRIEITERSGIKNRGWEGYYSKSHWNLYFIYRNN